jgi:hypothetical protein
MRSEFDILAMSHLYKSPAVGVRVQFFPHFAASITLLNGLECLNRSGVRYHTETLARLAGLAAPTLVW